ncbi:unnamed protein product [Rotaria socialis]|uniref:G-protein coupled receptors family 1 profile domain-containing protein n=3 Tax=Rotaria socialis TaxID=392032 RepID=A0A817ZEH1_9BILA|nr:unnamed protein product [Rotaria socialis]
MNTTTETIDFKYYIIKRSAPDNFGLQLRQFCQLFRFYSSIILVIVGMIGSMLSIKVFSSTKIRRNSSNEYLITMSFVVALLLFNFFCDEVLRWIVHDFHIDLPLNLVDLSMPLCKCSTYFRHTLRFAAHWIVVAFTLERLIVVYFPLQTSVLCNPRSARRICLFILIISFLLPFYSFLMSDINNDEKHNVFECDIMNKFKNIYFYLTIIYGNLTLTFPILIVCIVNILIVRQLLHAGRLRKKQQQQQLSQTKKVDSANNEYVNMIVKNQLENDKVTWMLVVISVTFGILNFPYFIFWLVVCISRVRGKVPSDYVESGKMIAEVCYLLNYSLNFFLYVISRRSFRKVLIEKMRWRCDWFEQWRLNEMRLDAALRSQQIPRSTSLLNGNENLNALNRDVNMADNWCRKHYSSNRSKKKLFKRPSIDNPVLRLNSLPHKLVNNLNAIQSTPIDLPLIEQKEIPFYLDNLMNIDSNNNDSKSIIKRSSYRIPSPTILLPGEFVTASKTITTSNTTMNKTQRPTPIDSNRNFLISNQPNSFHLNIHSMRSTEEFISNKMSTSSINSLNFIQDLPSPKRSLSNITITSQKLSTSHFEPFILHKKAHDSVLSAQKTFSTKHSSTRNSHGPNPTISCMQNLPN